MKPIALFLLLVATASLRADLTLVQKVDMAGTPGEVTIKFKADKIRINPAPQVSMITDAKTGDTITLMHGEKKAMRMSGDKMKAAAEMVKKFSGATPSEQKSKLVPLGRNEVVNGMTTEIFTTNTAVGKATYYIATTYPDAAGILQEMKTAQSSVLANAGANVPDFTDLPGVPVKIEMDTVRGHVVMTLVSIKRDPIPNSEFVVPADYTEVKMPDIFGGGKNVPGKPGEKIPTSPRTAPIASATP